MKVKVKVTQLYVTLATPWTIQSMEFSRKEYWSGSLSLLQGIFPTQGLNPGLLYCRQIFLPSEPQRKPNNPGVGNLSLLQQIFLIQESNRRPMHCRRILYLLSHQGRSDKQYCLKKKKQKKPHLNLYSYVLCAQALQLRLTLCDPMDCRPPGPSVHGILQARILELVAVPFFRGSYRPGD